MALLRLHAVFERRGAGAEDRAVCTYDFRVIGDTPWPAAAPHNYEEAEAAYDGFWNVVRGSYNANVVLDQLRWYREDDETLPWGEVSRVTERDVPGSSPTPSLPPQVAVTITERTSLRRHWGRTYLPNPGTYALNANGRFNQATGFANAAEALYERWIAARLQPVVIAHVRPSSNQLLGTPAPIQQLLPVTEVQVDDVFDVQRRRRFESVLARERRVIG